MVVGTRGLKIPPGQLWNRRRFVARAKWCERGGDGARGKRSGLPQKSIRRFSAGICRVLEFVPVIRLSAGNDSENIKEPGETSVSQIDS